MDPVTWTLALPPFAGLSPPDHALVADGLEVTLVRAGERVLEAGGPPSHHLWIIRKGHATLERDGEVQLLLEAGDWFGFPSLSTGDPPTADVVAQEDLLLYRLDETVARRLLTRPSVAQVVSTGLAARLRAARRDLEVPVSVRSVLSAPLLEVPASATLRDVAHAMESRRVSSAVVRGDAPRLVTDRDLRQALAAGRGPQDRVCGLPLSRALTLPVEANLDDAVQALLEHGVDHLLVVDGRPVGIVTKGDVLRARAASPVVLRRRISAIASPGELVAVRDALRRTVRGMLVGGVRPLVVSRALSALVDVMTRVLLRLAVERFGPAPVPYAWLALGSTARQEQTLVSDQDHALVHGPTDAAGEAWFASTARYVVDGLVLAGFPECPGGTMATRWSADLHTWVGRFRDWVSLPDQPALYAASVFFDHRVVAGTLDVGVLHGVVRSAADDANFVRRLAASADTARPALRWFHRLRSDEEGRVDLKHGAVQPLVELGRVLAVESAIAAPGTVERLRQAAGHRTLSPDLADALVESYDYLQGVRLEHQLSQVDRGRDPDDLVNVAELTSGGRRHVREAIAEIAGALRFTTDRFGARDVAP